MPNYGQQAAFPMIRNLLTAVWSRIRNWGLFDWALWLITAAVGLAVLGCCWDLGDPRVAYVALARIQFQFVFSVFLAICAVHIWRLDRRVTKSKWPRFSLRQVFGFLTLAALFFSSSVLTKAPFRLAFMLSTWQLDSLADDTLAGKNQDSLPRLVGQFYIVDARVESGAVILMLSDSYALVRTAAPRPHIDEYGPFDIAGGLMEHVAGEWYVVYNGYWNIKVGWS